MTARPLAIMAASIGLCLAAGCGDHTRTTRSASTDAIWRPIPEAEIWQEVAAPAPRAAAPSVEAAATDTNLIIAIAALIVILAIVAITAIALARPRRDASASTKAPQAGGP